MCTRKFFVLGLRWVRKSFILLLMGTSARKQVAVRIKEMAEAVNKALSWFSFIKFMPKTIRLTAVNTRPSFIRTFFGKGELRDLVLTFIIKFKVGFCHK